MKYFVTGATGFLGGSVARQLLAAGHTVNALVRDPAKAADLRSLGAALFPGDIADKESLREPMRGVDGLFHIAGWYKIGARDMREAQAINVDGTRNVLEVMRDLGIRKGVYTSSLVVFSDTHGRKPGESYIIAGPCHKVSEFFEMAEAITGIKASRMRASPGMMRATAGLVSVIEKVVPMPEEYASEHLRVNAGTTYMGDNAKARRE